MNEFRFQSLTIEQKIERVRTAPPWNPGLEVTQPAWVLARLDSVVEEIRADVAAQVDAGYLLDVTWLPAADRVLVLTELREMDKRVGSSDTDADGRSLVDYVSASSKSKAGLAVQQFIAHTAFYTATRLLLVRAWEDSGLLSPALLYNGGFHNLMVALDSVTAVVRAAFGRAGDKYPELFTRHNAFSWFTPDEPVYVNAIYDLANTYLGDLSDDILGEVYQRQLARVDRKQLGQYYTPRDVIKMMWDLVDVEPVAELADAQDRPVRILDIATGSGGFLVEGAARLRDRYVAARVAGEVREPKAFLMDITDGLMGCEVQQFSAYLAEVNLVLQFSSLLRDSAPLRLPAFRVHCADTLTLHNPDTVSLIGALSTVTVRDGSGLQTAAEVEERQDSIDRLRDPNPSGEWLDVAVGNPPYVGEKSIAKTMVDLQARHPYWRQFSASHTDYLYNFLILGVSKLRAGGRFAFITTEYWLKATGASPLRGYLAEHTHIERLILFRDLTLFPDAPGQHNLVVTGRRVTDPTRPDVTRPTRPGSKTKVSLYVGPARPPSRVLVLDAMRLGLNRSTQALVRTFDSQRDPATLGSRSWAEAIMTREQLTRRSAIARSAMKAGLVMSEGVIATPQTLKPSHAPQLSQKALEDIGGKDSRAGIFLLQDAEVATMRHDAGDFTDAEREHLRPVINTRDVFPYAVVLPSAPSWLIWLPGSHGGPGGTFPVGMPTLRLHLERFKPLLESVVAGYGRGTMQRPWWSAHRPRLELVEGHPAEGEWADLAVTTRWGDRKLVVGLAPARSLPASGLHAITGAGGTSAAYLVGLINSTPVQELAEALSPGSVSQGDLQALGLPQFDRVVTAGIERRARELAEVVRTLIAEHNSLWPGLENALRTDTTLSGDLKSAWAPTPSARGWGTINTVGWATVHAQNAVSGTVERTALVTDLLGTHLEISFTRGKINIETDEHPDPRQDLRVLVEALVRGAGALTAAQVRALPVPVRADTLRLAWERDLRSLTAVTDRYRQLRAEIDNLVVTALGA